MSQPITPSGYWTPNNQAPRLGGAPGRAPTNTFAWLGLIISVSGFIVPLGINGLLGVGFSLVGLRDARKLADAGHTDTGRSIAMAGLVVGIVHVIVTLGVIVLAIFAWGWFNDWIETLTTELQNSNLS
ncbi:MAG: hypothetical protein ABI566_11845 [Pseudolysinimonas sp.]